MLRYPPPAQKLVPFVLSRSPAQCERTLPEFRGYAAPSFAVLLGVFLVGSTAFVCGIAAISVAREYVKESAASRESAAVAQSAALTRRAGTAPAAPSGDGEYMMLVGNERRGLVNDDPSAEEEGEADLGKGKAATRTGRARRTRRGRTDAATVEAPGPSPLANKVYFFTRLICGTGMAAALLMCALVVAFSPHTPGVNVCNTEFDWVSTRPFGVRRSGALC